MTEIERERVEWERYQAISAKKIRPIFRKALMTQIKPVLDWIERHGVKNVPVTVLIDRTVWFDAYQKAYSQLGIQAAKREYRYQKKMDGMLDSEEKSTSLDFFSDIWSTIMRNYASGYTDFIRNELNDTTVNILLNALGENYELLIDENEIVRLIRKDILKKFNGRINKISRTESTTIANIGKELGARQWLDELGDSGFKAWYGRVINERPEHLAVNNTIIPLNDKYIVGGQECDRPGDVNLSAGMRINCRCSQTIMSTRRKQQYEKRGLIVDGKIIE